MVERDFQGNFIKKIKTRIPDCKIVKNDPNYCQGVPDLTVFYKEKYAVLEAKKDNDARFRPNQEDYLKIFGKYTFARKVEPENQEEVINGLCEFFGV